MDLRFTSRRVERDPPRSPIARVSRMVSVGIPLAYPILTMKLDELLAEFGIVPPCRWNSDRTRIGYDTRTVCECCDQAVWVTADALTEENATTECGGIDNGSCAVYAAGGFAAIADAANKVASESRRGGAPHLDATSPRETLCDWLQWCDPNGIHTDDLAINDRADPYTLKEAWQAIAMMIDNA